MKPIDADKFFNIRVIISELESGLNCDDTIYISFVPEGETESSVVEEVHKDVITVVEVCEEVDATVVPEKKLKNQV